MGWLFRCDPRYKRDDLIKDLRRPDRWSAGTTLLQACTKGNHHWYLAKTGDTIWIGLDLMQGGGRNQGWGYKDMDETVGPYQTDCPISYINKASPTEHEYANAWRKKVCEHHATRKARPAYASSMRVELNNVVYTLIEPYAPRRGWIVKDSHGNTYRMRARQLARSTIVEGT